MKKEDCIEGVSYKLNGLTFDHFGNEVQEGTIVTVVQNDTGEGVVWVVWVCRDSSYEVGLNCMDDSVFHANPADLIPINTTPKEITPEDILTKNIEVITAFANGARIMCLGSRGWFHVGRDDSIDLKEQYKLDDGDICHPRKAAILRWLELAKTNEQGKLYYSEDGEDFQCNKYIANFGSDREFYEKVVIS